MRTIAVAILLLFGGVAVAGPCQTRVFETSHFIVCGFDSRDMTMRIVVADRRGAPYRSFAAWAQGHDTRKVRFAMNAGMFGTDFRPIGLYVEDGVRRRRANTRDGGGNFHMKPNGVFAQRRDGSLLLLATEDFLAAAPAVRWATQSGPMLVIDGALHPGISPDGPSRNIRNGVGLIDAHRAWFVISEDPVSFGRFARFFRDGLNTPNALYFDGAVSSLWLPAENRRDNAVELGPMVIVEDK
jgi:uncharacterized protein YigE (DUF2233 family)